MASAATDLEYIEPSNPDEFEERSLDPAIVRVEIAPVELRRDPVVVSRSARRSRSRR